MEEELVNFSQLQRRTMRIWANTKENKTKYQTSIYNKKMDKPNMYIDVYFKGVADIPNGSDILVKDGFWSFYKTNNGLPKPIIRINEFEIISDLPF